VNCIIWVSPLRKNPIPEITFLRAEIEPFAGDSKGRTEVIKRNIRTPLRPQLIRITLSVTSTCPAQWSI